MFGLFSVKAGRNSLRITNLITVGTDPVTGAATRNVSRAIFPTVEEANAKATQLITNGSTSAFVVLPVIAATAETPQEG